MVLPSAQRVAAQIGTQLRCDALRTKRLAVYGQTGEFQLGALLHSSDKYGFCIVNLELWAFETISNLVFEAWNSRPLPTLGAKIFSKTEPCAGPSRTWSPQMRQLAL